MIRPITLVSMPTPLMSLPMRSTSSTSRSSIGSRGMLARASAEQSRAHAPGSACRQEPPPPSSGRGSSRRSRPPARCCRGPAPGGPRAACSSRRPRVPYACSGLGLHLLAESDRRHLHQPALVPAVEIGVRLHPVDEDGGSAAAATASKTTGTGQSPRGSSTTSIVGPDRATRAQPSPYDASTSRLPVGGRPAVAPHGRHEERLAALLDDPTRHPGDDRHLIADPP